MLIGYTVGALTMLVGISIGFVFGKPWLDRWQSRKHQNNKPKSGATP